MGDPLQCSIDGRWFEDMDSLESHCKREHGTTIDRLAIAIVRGIKREGWPVGVQEFVNSAGGLELGFAKSMEDTKARELVCESRSGGRFKVTVEEVG